MDWLTALEILGMAITFVFMALLVKELKKSFKENSNGKVSGRCELD